ncbi:MAG: hypothetical protein QOE69_3045 [Thermoleophilaceae bacterium]|nr:hypothetical protein [Thermoleophilaceae bacterium]MEA2408926.1 hypothetical protein [Thermoleophilaceae bacterium]
MSAGSATAASGARSTWLVAQDEPPTKRGRDTRQRLLEAAAELFATKAYHQVAVADIAPESGVAVGSFYRYFENKEELFLVLFSDVCWGMYTSVQGRWDEGRDLLANLVDVTQAYLESWYERRGFLAAAFEVMHVTPQAREMWWAMRHDLQQQMARQLEDAGGSLRFDPGPELTTATRALGAMVEQYARSAYVEEEYGPPSGERVADDARVLAEIWLEGVGL